MAKALILMGFLALSGITSAHGAEALGHSRLPDPISPTKWFRQHCVPLIKKQVRMWPDVGRWELQYIWKSETGYLLDWRVGLKASQAGHYCTRMKLFGRDDHFVDSETFMCTSIDAGTPTETWTFGDIELAAQVCGANSEALAAMDSAQPLGQGKVSRP